MIEPNSTLITDLSVNDQEKRGWKVTVNGELVVNVSRVTITNLRFGAFNYGKTVPGYDGWSFKQTGGGGAVIIPFAFVNKDPNMPAVLSCYVGVVKQNRHNQGGEVWNVPRGFSEPREIAITTAKRELTQELGVRRQIFPLPGDPVNPNSAFFETLNPDEGDTFWAVEFLREELIEQIEADAPSHIGKLQLKPGIFKPDNKDAEKILSCMFTSIESAAMLSDMYTVAATARLAFYLDNQAGRACPHS